MSWFTQIFLTINRSKRMWGLISKAHWNSRAEFFPTKDNICVLNLKIQTPLKYCNIRFFIDISIFLHQNVQALTTVLLSPIDLSFFFFSCTYNMKHSKMKVTNKCQHTKCSLQSKVFVLSLCSNLFKQLPHKMFL